MEELLSLIWIPLFPAVKLIDVFKVLKKPPLVDMFAGSKRGEKAGYLFKENNLENIFRDL